jgi:hypothetical protein
MFALNVKQRANLSTSAAIFPNGERQMLSIRLFCRSNRSDWANATGRISSNFISAVLSSIWINSGYLKNSLQDRLTAEAPKGMVVSSISILSTKAHTHLCKSFSDSSTFLNTT